MGVISIVLPRRLDAKLREKAEEAGFLPEELALEFVRKSLSEEIDPEELVEHYKALSEKYLAEGKELLKKGDLVQASEKLWGAAALAVKMVAAKRGIKLEKHGSLWRFVNNLAVESGDKDIVRAFYAANALHRNFYEMAKETVEIGAEDIERLISKLRGIK